MDTEKSPPLVIHSSWFIVSFMLILVGGFFAGGMAGFGKATSAVSVSCIMLCLCSNDPSF